MSDENIWDDPISLREVLSDEPKTKKSKAKPKEVTYDSEYDIEGLMTDFPTANLLERFVYDETGVVLNLKGRANQLKYKVALDVLNGKDIDSKFIGNENPYIDKNDLVPVEEPKPVPARDSDLPNRSEIQILIHSSSYVLHLWCRPPYRIQLIQLHLS